MSESITYNFGAIAEVAVAIQTFQVTMEQQLQDLYDQFTQLFAQDWSSGAGQACDEARTKWNQGADEIKQALATLGAKLNKAAENMQGLDVKIAGNM